MEDRFKKLNKYGYSGPMSLATAMTQYFPHVFKTQHGYWAYVIYKNKIPIFPDVVYFVGDPICDSIYLIDFIKEAVRTLSKKGRVCAVQVHKQTAMILESIKNKKYFSHQFGVENFVKLPYELIGQVGTKVRQSIKAGLYVEELTWEEKSIQDKEIEIKIELPSLWIKKNIKKIITNEFNKDILNKKILESNDNNLIFNCERLLNIIDEILKIKEEPSLQRFKKKIEAMKKKEVLNDVILFFEENLNELIGFGYYQTTSLGYNCHRYEIIKSLKYKNCLLLARGKNKISQEDMLKITSISDYWLSSKLNRKEMGPPLLKPFSEKYEPNRRLFVAKNAKNEIVAFVDFDPVNWINQDGILDKNKKGYYTNLIRHIDIVDENKNILYKHVRFLIIGAAIQRFVQEGCSFINLGLSPFSNINKNNKIGNKKTFFIKGCTFFEIIFNWIANSSLLNKTTFAYNNVNKTKKQNWLENKKEEIMTYIVFEGNLFWQFYDMVAVFFVTGAMGSHIFKNFLHNFLYNKKTASCK